jgi:hypothetical protein
MSFSCRATAEAYCAAVAVDEDRCSTVTRHEFLGVGDTLTQRRRATGEGRPAAASAWTLSAIATQGVPSYVARMTDLPGAQASCPFCGVELASQDQSCGGCGAALVAQPPAGSGTAPGKGSARAGWLAVTRRTYDGQPLTVWEESAEGRAARERQARGEPAADPVITIDPVKIGPDTCSGCDDKAIFVVGGQAAVYLLEGCDDDWCFYDNPQGIV